VVTGVGAAVRFTGAAVGVGVAIGVAAAVADGLDVAALVTAGPDPPLPALEQPTSKARASGRAK